MVSGIKRKVFVGGMLAMAGAIGLAIASVFIRPSPEAALQEFYSSESLPEQQLMDPLIKAGDRVVPLVIAEVQKADMPRRRYAIGFLGNQGLRESLPVLRQIVLDVKENAFFRADALQSIWMIDPIEGIALAQRFKDETTFLGYIACKLLTGTDLPVRRSYWDALTGRLD